MLVDMKISETPQDNLRLFPGPYMSFCLYCTVYMFPMNPLIQYSHNSIHDVVYRCDNSFGTDTWIPLLDILLERKFVWFHNLHKISLHILCGVLEKQKFPTTHIKFPFHGRSKMSFCVVISQTPFFRTYHFRKLHCFRIKLTCEPDLSVVSFLPGLARMKTTV